jgi:hypothetical protein
MVKHTSNATTPRFKRARLLLPAIIGSLVTSIHSMNPLDTLESTIVTPNQKYGVTLEVFPLSNKTPEIPAQCGTIIQTVKFADLSQAISTIPIRRVGDSLGFAWQYYDSYNIDPRWDTVETMVAVTPHSFHEERKLIGWDTQKILTISTDPYSVWNKRICDLSSGAIRQHDEITVWHSRRNSALDSISRSGGYYSNFNDSYQENYSMSGKTASNADSSLCAINSGVWTYQKNTAFSGHAPGQYITTADTLFDSVVCSYSYDAYKRLQSSQKTTVRLYNTHDTTGGKPDTIDRIQCTYIYNQITNTLDTEYYRVWDKTSSKYSLVLHAVHFYNSKKLLTRYTLQRFGNVNAGITSYEFLYDQYDRYTHRLFNGDTLEQFIYTTSIAPKLRSATKSDIHLAVISDRGTIVVDLQLSKPDNISLSLYSMNGQKVAVPRTNHLCPAGLTRIRFPLVNTAAGIFLVKAQSPEGLIANQKIVIK